VRRVLLVVLFTSAVVQIAAAGVVVIDFESFADRNLVTNQIPGLTFTNTVILTAGFSLNALDFPPHSGVNVASDSGGAITIVFDTPLFDFGGYFTYTQPLTLAGFDAPSTEVASAASLFSTNYTSSGNPPNGFLHVSSPGGLAPSRSPATPPAALSQWTI
jgi:hypothetical protein